MTDCAILFAVDVSHYQIACWVQSPLADTLTR